MRQPAEGKESDSPSGTAFYELIIDHILEEEETGTEFKNIGVDNIDIVLDKIRNNPGARILSDKFYGAGSYIAVIIDPNGKILILREDKYNS